MRRELLQNKRTYRYEISTNALFAKSTMKTKLKPLQNVTQSKNVDAIRETSLTLQDLIYIKHYKVAIFA